MAIFTITSTADTAGDASVGTQIGSTGKYQGTLPEAINFANLNTTSPATVTTIGVDPALAAAGGTITLASDLPLVATSIDLNAGGLTLDGAIVKEQPLRRLRVEFASVSRELRTCP